MSDAEYLTVGSPIPDVTLPDQSGKPRALSSLLGSRGAVIYFYPKDATPGCTTEGLEFQALLPEFTAKEVAVIAVSRDSVKSHASFCGKQGFTFPLLADTETTMCQAFGVWQEKIACGKTTIGIVRTTFVVDGEGRVTKVYEKVKAPGHARAVLDGLPG